MPTNINLKTIKKIDKYINTSDNSPFFLQICRFFSYPVTLLFLRLNISSTATTYLNFLLGIAMTFFFIQSTFLFYNIAIIFLLWFTCLIYGWKYLEDKKHRHFTDDF